jgi:hypothetical protein
MSIVTDALNRLQAERTPVTSNGEASSDPKISQSSDIPKPGIPSSQSPAHTIRNILRVSLIIVAIGAAGIGAYLWGLTLMPDVARVSPEHRNPETIPEPSPVEPELTQVVEAVPEPGLEEPSSEIVVGESGNPPEASNPVEAVETPLISSQPLDPIEVVPASKVAETQATSSAPTETPTVAKSNKQIAKVIPSVSPSPPDSTSQPQPPVVNTSVESPPRTEFLMPPIPRNATIVEGKLIQVKYLISKRRYRHALIVLQPLFATPPATWEPWFWFGTAKLGLGEWKEAEESFVEGLSRNAKVPQLWVQRALVGQQQGKFGEAVEALRQAELIAPELPEVQLNLAYSLEVQGQIKPAVDHYHTFLAITEGRKAYQPARKKVLQRIIRLETT